MFSNFNCIYSNNFKYPYGIEEIRGIVECTITQILFNARLRAFCSQPYYIVELDSETNLLQTELILMDSVDGYSESREKHDLKRLNEHYRALKIKCAKHYDKMCDQYNESQYSTSKIIQPVFLAQVWNPCLFMEWIFPKRTSIFWNSIWNLFHCIVLCMTELGVPAF